MRPADDAVPASERRRDPRKEVDVAARLTLVGLTVDGRLRNVSARGVCFVTTDPHLRVEASNFVQIEFEHPDANEGRPIRRQVRVTRVEPDEEAGPKGRRLGLAWDEPVILQPN